MAMAEEKLASANGSVDASPRITAVLEPFTWAASFAANGWSYSRLVTRGARSANSCVATPGPAPSSNMWSPNSETFTIHGKRFLRVIHRQYGDPQNHVSHEFIDISEYFAGSLLYRGRAELMKHGTDLTERRSELIGVIGRGIFE